MSLRPSSLSASCAIRLFFLFIALIVLNAHAGDADFTGYRGMNFSFSYPAAWKISNDVSSSSISGNISLDESCNRFSLHWIRDPGISPKEVLDQIENNYNRGGVSISSGKRRTIDMQEQTAETLTLTYEFRDSKRTRIFAVWNSSPSDRMFIAAFSGCMRSGSVNSKDDTMPFERIVSSFNDLGRHDRIGLNPRPSAGAWPIVLEDLLSSYHYKDSGTLLAGVVHTKVDQELSWVNGSYSLDSHESIWSDPPKTAVSRAGAVLHILQQAGYMARSVQRRGKIGVAVYDPDGKWVQISIDPEDPARMVGLLSNETGEILVYANYNDLARENGIERDTESGIKSLIRNGNDMNLDRVVQKDCEPSCYLELKPADQVSNSWRKSLRDLLKSHEYRRYYEKDIFDCSSTAQICWSTLTEKGYDARLMLSYKGHPLKDHMWIVVEAPYEKGRYVAIETANVDEKMWLVNLGRVVADEEYYRGIMYNSSAQFSWMHPDEGM